MKIFEDAITGKIQIYPPKKFVPPVASSYETSHKNLQKKFPPFGGAFFISKIFALQIKIALVEWRQPNKNQANSAKRLFGL